MFFFNKILNLISDELVAITLFHKYTTFTAVIKISYFS